MALIPSEKSAARRACGKELSLTGGITYSKSQINAALDAVDAKWESAWQAEVNAEIDAPGFSFSAQQKQLIRKNWLAVRAPKE